MDAIKLLNIDCLELMATYPDKYFDLAIVDPPYGIGQYWMKQVHTYHYGRNNWNEQPPNAEYFRELFRVSKNQIIWGGNYFTEFLPATNSWIIWDKGNDVEKMNTSECELAWTSFNVPMRKVFVQWSGGRKGLETNTKCIHPCQRPVQLHSWILQKYAKPDFKILDTHLGSASSAIAAERFGIAEFVGSEIDADYHRRATARFLRVTAQKFLF